MCKKNIFQPSARNSVFVSSDEISESSQVNGIQKALPRIMISASAMSAKKNMPIGVMGIDFRSEDANDNVYLKHISDGSLPLSNEDRSVVVGKKLLEKLGLEKDQKLIIQFSDKNEDIQSELLLWIRAVFSTGSTNVDTSTILVPIKILQKYLRYQYNEYSFVSFIMNDPRRLEDAKKDLSKIYSMNNSGVVLDWKSSLKSLYAFVNLDKSSGLFFIYILALIVALGNLNTILMSVLERKKEFGMMLAIGMKPGQLIFNVVCEAVVMSFLGVALGFVLGSLTHFYFLFVGVDLGNILGEGDVSNTLFDPILRSKLYLGDYIISALSFILLTVLASLYPALKIRNLNPIEVMTR